METSTRIIELASYTLPAIIVGLVAYYFFNLYVSNEEGRRLFLLKKKLQKESLPIRLQAYERMTLFLERINCISLLIRVSPTSDSKYDYANYLISSIEQEFEHNLAQQIYMSDNCWKIINTSKNMTLQIIRKAIADERVHDADSLREVLLMDLGDKESPTEVALSYIKMEVGQLWF